MNPSLTESSKEFWSARTHANHRHSGDEWFKLYAEELLAFLPRGGRLLDVGCGACELTVHLAPHYSELVAVDFSSSMLTEATKRIQARGLTNLSVMEAEAVNLAAVPGKFDVILAFSVLQYLDQPSLEAHLRECLRVLNPDGTICWGQVPNDRLKWMLRLGLLRAPRPGWLQLARRAWDVWRTERATIRRHDNFWDGVGRWFDPRVIESVAATHGLECVFRQNWYYEYRFHATLRRPSGATPVSAVASK